ncbi:hypothetical protein [Aeromonas taiwanensis]|jgi:hypothetical protein|uniref:hypothetical protein n=1 Tax=Aeromonas taiwanensis TaxID=633417 RepID=UPI00143226E7|nr:hypothetical protein [Aeromonas taiwanensis]
MKTFDAVSTLLIGAKPAVHQRTEPYRHHPRHVGNRYLGVEGMTGLHQAPNITLTTSVGCIQGGEA